MTHEPAFERFEASSPQGRTYRVATLASRIGRIGTFLLGSNNVAGTALVSENIYIAPAELARLLRELRFAP